MSNDHRVDQLERQVAQLERQVAQLSRQRTSHFAQARSLAPAVDGGNVQTIQGQINPISKRDEMPVLFHYGFSSSLPVNGDKIIANIDGDPSRAVVIATNHQTHRFKGLTEGQTVMFDMFGHSILLSATGITIQCAALPVTFVDAGIITMQTPLLQVTGDIIDQSATNPLTLAETRTAFNAHIHPVHNVQTGLSTVNTGVPTVPET